ncbi:MAG: hypothetical protein GEU99_17555 [Luteitalea sp.]|nr:hypothetical protein [Luteitalea sp.]
MVRISVLALTVGLAVSGPGVVAAGADDAKTTTWTGWFSDKGCASPRVANGIIGPNNPDCVKRCLDEGATPVFVSEQAEAVFEVRDYEAVENDVGYHIELTGIVDEAAKTISVRSVKRLSYVGALCALPKRTGAKK